MEISKNRSATARKSSEQPRQDTAKTALITPLRSLYSFIFPHQSSRHGIALFRPLGSIRALVALFRPLGSIRALAPAMCSLRCAHTPTQPPYFAIAPYGLSVALFRPLGSIRALCRPISPVGLDTGSKSPYRPLRARYGLLLRYCPAVGAIRSAAPAMCSAPAGPCAHTPTPLCGCWGVAPATPWLDLSL